MPAPSYQNLLVFAASPEIVTMIESTGAMGIYHPGYASVSRRASDGYMDKTFVDMMWYKAFSVYLLLRLKINVLFQDADLVWFRDPFPYFQQVIKENEEKAKRTGTIIIIPSLLYSTQPYHPCPALPCPALTAPTHPLTPTYPLAFTHAPSHHPPSHHPPSHHGPG